ncbi:hypothetical protein ABIB48_001221 [Arthrobacter sp. UYCu511]|uniref:hypothetical protein n=1 Tax=Arthrobacter sp. UYCu511 TaxID=3156337 RepID=UPI003398D3DF
MGIPLCRSTTPASRRAPLTCLAPGCLALGFFALVLGGCSAVGASPLEYTPEPAAIQPAVDCSTAGWWEPEAASPSSLHKGSIPEGFTTVGVVRCTSDPISGVVEEDHLSGDFAPLLAALAQPSERGGPVSCLDYAELPPAIWLVNAEGQAVNIQWPLDSCEHTKPDTAKALQALTVSESRSVPSPEAAP